MGMPKAALKFGSRTILERLIDELRIAFREILIIAAPAEAEGFPIEQLLLWGPASLRLLRDQTAFAGAAVALTRGLTAASYDTAFVCSCDLPLLQVEVARALFRMLDGYDAVIPDIDGKPQPLCAVYRRSAAAAIEARLVSGERRLTSIADALKAYRPGDSELRQIDPELRNFVNINTPEDYQRALALQQSLDAGKSR
jgi:molybdopterin-guanine dinucleotide biosynthesis protein A